jgi:hypothetical protein
VIAIGTKPAHDADRATFVAISSVLTGFAPLDLEGTGMVSTYLSTLHREVDLATRTAFFVLARSILERGSEAAIDAGVRDELLPSATLGPVARGLIKLWYYATWPPASGPGKIVSAQGYVEGLVWPAIGTHPRGAKQPGFATWSFPPPDPPDGAR